VIIVGDIGRTLTREERSGKPEDAPLAEPAPQPEPAAPEREPVPA
jgi:hypothetical protein